MCVLSKEQQDHDNKNVDSMTSILEFMNVFAQKLQYSDQKNVVLVLGNTGAGKTTLTSLLSGVELQSKEVVIGSGEFVIVDERELISGLSTTISKTEIPELMFDASNKVTYYDCPGFNDSRGVEHDISVTYLISKLIKFANSVKLVFAISFASVRTGVGDRHDFMDLVLHAVNFAKNMDTYRDGIALIVTKVENRYVTKNRQPQLIEDDKLIEGIAEFLKQAKIDLESMNHQEIPAEDKELNRKKITFIEILLEQNAQNQYTKIGILRLADESGSIKDIEMLQTERKTIEEMINHNLKFVNKQNNDFGYTISEKSKNRIYEKIEEMQIRLTKDIQDIGDEIQSFYLQQEKHFFDLCILKSKFSIAHQMLSDIESNDPKKFVELITKVANDLKIGITIDNANQFWNHMECVDFINAVSMIKLSNSFNISLGLASVKQYLFDSKNWYCFLIELHNKLSEYNVQNTNSKINVNELLNSIPDNHETNVNERLEQILEGIVDINTLNNINYAAVENIQLNSFKLRALKMILNRTLNHNLNTSTQPHDRLVVKGYNVKISDVIPLIESNGKKYIHVFAINNLFIDADIIAIGQKIQLSFIAPTWYVIGNRQINLSGKDGESHSESRAADANNNELDGKNGLPGNPGGSAGHFAGIGKQFFDANNLQINISGGRGGDGQHGGNGRDARDGRDPETPKFKALWRDFGGLKFKPEFTLQKIPPFIGMKYDIKGSDGLRPGKGGHGGCGGYGGEPGEDFIIGFEHHPEMIVSSRKGDMGSDGECGEGGKRAKKGSNTVANYVFLVVGLLKLDQQVRPGMAIEAGESGSNGLNNENQLAAEICSFINPSQTINDYKSYAREYLPENICETQLSEFSSQFDKNQQIQLQYDILSLVNELQGLERQYIELRDKISFAPFLESLLNRINIYVQNRDLSNDDAIVLKYLHVATLTKLSSIKNRARLCTIDLLAYIRLAQNHIKLLRGAQRNDAIHVNQEKFKQSLEDKINMANYFIKSQIMPTINRSLEEIDKNILGLIDKNSGHQTTIKEQELKNACISPKILFWIEVTGTLVLCLGTAAAVVFASGVLAQKCIQGKPASLSLSSVENAALGSGQNVLGNSRRLIPPMSEIKSVSIQMKNKFEACAKKFKTEYRGVENKLREYLGNETLTNWKQNIGKPLSKIINEKPNVPKIPKNSNNNIGKLQESHAKILELDKTNQKVPGNGLEIQECSTAGASTVRAYDGLSKNSRQLLLSLDRQEKKLYESLIPKLHEIESTITKLEHNLPNQSHVELDLSKWHIQSLIEDLRAYLNQLTVGFSIEDDLQRSIENLNEGMFVLIGVYDRIESYVEKCKLVAFLANISSTSHRTNNDELNHAITHLEKMIQRNIILEQYESVMHAFRQNVFPFVHPNIINCFQQVKPDETDADVLVEQAIERINFLENRLHVDKIAIEKYDKDIINFKFDDFYTWKNEEIKNDIGKLLQGEEIVIKADIAKGMSQNAVKFNEIAIILQLANDKAQNELDDKLASFDVVMKMMGNCYYRCGNRSYFVPIDENIEIEYSMKKDIHGNPIRKNEVYRKIRDGQNFLSPYTTWCIKLIDKCGREFHDLTKFNNDAIDLKLVGHGQYFKYEKAFSDEFADELMNKHYNFDRIIPYENDTKLLNTL